MFPVLALKRIYLKMTYLGTILIVLASTCYPFCAAQEIFEEAFQVNPGGQLTTVERKIEWQFSLKKSDDKNEEFTCAVYRPGGMSYLFFLQFKLAVTGAKVQEVELYGAGGAALGSEEYVLDKEKHEVIHAEGMFRSQLSRILMIAKYSKRRKQKPKREL